MFVDPSSLIHSAATDRYNHGHYQNSEVDSLLEVALALTDRKQAQPVWDRLQEVVAADLPMAFLYYPDTLVGVRNRLRSVRPHMLSPFNNICDWWISEQDRKYNTPPAEVPSP
jgi:ABC-type transport system substrate-binding protein